MKLNMKHLALVAAFAAYGCDKGTTSDPSTVTRDALNPPAGLTTVTLDKKIQLRWAAANAEDDFKGYHVFAVAKKLSEIPAATYPKNLTVDLATGSIPRCADNTKTFEAFGFAVNETDCEGDAEAPAAATGSTLLAIEETDKITNIALCDENTADTTISLPGVKPTLTEQVCTVSKLADGTALANGTTYTFFVAAVMGDEKNVMSWTSNFASDTPATSLLDKADWSVASGKYYAIPASKLISLATIGDTDITSGDCPATAPAPGGASVCHIYRFNQMDVATADGVYFGRAGGSISYPQRIFVSVPENSKVEIQLRGPQVFDTDNSFAKSIPGDRAANTTYLQKTLYPLYGYQVFDLKVTATDGVHYGKIVIGKMALSTGTDAASDMTVPITVIMQPQVGSFDYFTGEN